MTLHLPSFWRLGWRSFWRDARAGEFNVLMLAMVLAVASVTAVAFFADRLQRGLARDAAQWLGGDAVLRADQAMPDLEARARAIGLKTDAQVLFPTMARADEQQGGAVRLISLKAVSPDYPLRGQVETQVAPGQATQVAQMAPAEGEVWVDPSLLVALDVQVGDRLWLGEQALTIGRLLLHEPDRGSGFMNLAPRVLMNRADLAATQLLQPASRVTHRLAVAGSPPQVGTFAEWGEAAVRAADKRGMRLETLESGRPEMQQALERASAFLQLVSLLSAVLSALAVVMAARQYVRRHLDACALLRVMGVSQSTMARAFALSFGLAGLLAGAIGTVLGFAAHHLLLGWLAGWMQTGLPAPGWQPWWQGVTLALVLLFTFAWPPVLQLAQVPPLRVIRRDALAANARGRWVTVLGVALLAGWVWAVGRAPGLAVVVIAGALLTMALTGAMAYGLMRGLLWLGQHWPQARLLRLSWRLLQARPGQTLLQMGALSLGLVALLLLWLVRTDLLHSWQSAMPAQAPDRFVINIQPDEADAFQAQLKAHGVTDFDWYPMVRGRLVAVNDRPVQADQYADERARRLVEREFNLSFSAQRPAHNPLVAGTWTANEPGTISLESGLAERLGLGVGDRLRFDWAGHTAEARVTSIRQVEWGSMRVNFFALFPVDQLPDAAVTYITAFRQVGGDAADRRLTRQFPHITLVDVGAALQQLQSVLTQVAKAMEFMFLLTVATGWLVLWAGMVAGRTQRLHEWALMRACGADRRLLLRLQWFEWLGVGALVGGLSAAVALGMAGVLAQSVFGLRWALPLWVLGIGPVLGASLSSLAGWWSMRGVWRQPVASYLREGDR